MKKLNQEVLAVVFYVLIVVATTVLAIYELITKGTVTGLTLIPLFIVLVVKAVQMIAADIPNIKELIENAEDE